MIIKIPKTKSLFNYKKKQQRINALEEIVTIWLRLTIGLGLWCLTPLTTIYFSYIAADSFIGGGNRRKPPTCRKSLINLSHKVVSSIPSRERDYSSLNTNKTTSYGVGNPALCLTVALTSVKVIFVPLSGTVREMYLTPLRLSE